MLDEIRIYTVEVVSRCFLGDYATQDVLDDIARLLPELSKGFISVPRRLPWPFNILPAFSFARSFDAKNNFKHTFNRILHAHRAHLETAEIDGTVIRTAGIIVDSLLEVQRRQVYNGEATEKELVWDDDFIFDNVRAVSSFSVFFNQHVFCPQYVVFASSAIFKLRVISRNDSTIMPCAIATETGLGL